MADRAAEDGTGAEDDADQAYRADLAKATQPAKPTPLVLVSNRDAEGSGGAVRPRRVAPNTVKPADSDAEAFVEYAGKLGATDLPDVMEAAAAFLNQVEELPSFSRPQILHLVRRLDRENRFTREDTLQTFDKLERGGAFQKVGRGQFALAEDSRFAS